MCAQSTSSDEHVPHRDEPDADEDRARVLQWKRRTSAFAWACGLRIVEAAD